MKVPSLNYEQVVRALRRDGWVVVRRRGSHIRLQKHTVDETLKLVVAGAPAVQRQAVRLFVMRLV